MNLLLQLVANRNHLAGSIPRIVSLEDAHPTTWRLLMRVHWLVVEAIREALREEHDLPLEWYDVLVHLAEAPGDRLRMSELAQSLVLSRSWLTRRMDALEDAGLVEREPADSDGRGRYAVLTSRGLQTLHRAELTRRRILDQSFYRHLDRRKLSGMRAGLLAVSTSGEQDAR